jgi:hypothetical protein
VTDSTTTPTTVGTLLKLGRDFATVAETGQIMRADPRTIRRRIKDGTIPAVRASDWRIPVSWLAEQAGVQA